MVAGRGPLADTSPMNRTSLLGTWYADPMTPQQAAALLADCEERENRRKRHAGNLLVCRLQKMIARYWLGDDIGPHYGMLRTTAGRSAHGRALLELIYGQLLLSRRLAEGMVHLERGFRMATTLFSAADYLLVMNRHRLLRQLPLGEQPANAEPLEALLTSARVIERMRGAGQHRPVYSHDPKDTYG